MRRIRPKREHVNSRKALKCSVPDCAAMRDKGTSRCAVHRGPGRKAPKV